MKKYEQLEFDLFNAIRSDECVEVVHKLAQLANISERYIKCFGDFTKEELEQISNFGDPTFTGLNYAKIDNKIYSFDVHKREMDMEQLVKHGTKWKECYEER